MPELPEALAGMQMDEASTEAFRKDAHAMGLSQAQFEKVMGKYFEVAPGLVGAGQQLSAEETVRTLQTEIWKDPKEYQTNMGAAYRAAVAYAGQENLAEVEKQLGNNPLFIRIMAKVGAELKEDTPPVAASGGMAAGSAVEDLMKSEAYSNAKHPDHKKVSAQVAAHFAKTVGTAPVA